MSLITENFYNRDLSWLRFNYRVLQEAEDTRNPLYERIKFLAIFSSNLDEFFKVRVSDIRQIKELDKSFRKKLISKPNKLLKTIKKEVDQQQRKFGKIFFNQILPELKKEGIIFINDTIFNESQVEFAEEYYANLISSNSLVLQNDPFIENEKLYLFAVKEGKRIWVKIDNDISRFVIFPKENNHYYVSFVDDIIRQNLEKEFGVPFFAVKVSRDAELYIDNEFSGNLLEKIKESLPNRDTGQVTRMLVDQFIPESYIDALKKDLDVNETDIIKGGKYHNFKDLFGFPNPTNKDLSFIQLNPVEVTELKEYNSLFDAVRIKDRLFSYPYESFDSLIEFVEEASADVSVTEIKMTLYRMSSDSKIAQSLIKAVENNIDVTIFIETKARFDEENNIKWGKILEEKGVKVYYSYPGIKVHSKILLVKRLINGNEEQFAYIGTGNFNEKTAKIYTDFGLLTANAKITNDIFNVFSVLEGNLIVPKTKKLLVSPFNTRSSFVALIQNEIDNAMQGEVSGITLKLNSLQDEKMIKLLYKASQAGVNIKIICRGICCLVPGVKGQSENIEIISIVDRFLEHARVYIFSNNGKEKMFIGSADFMTRNLDHRIEVITPIIDKNIKSKIKHIIQLQLEDDTKARVIDTIQSNTYLAKNEMYRESSQHKIYSFLKKYHEEKNTVVRELKEL